MHFIRKGILITSADYRLLQLLLLIAGVGAIKAAALRQGRGWEFYKAGSDRRQRHSAQLMAAKTPQQRGQIDKQSAITAPSQSNQTPPTLHHVTDRRRGEQTELGRNMVDCKHADAKAFQALIPNYQHYSET